MTTMQDAQVDRAQALELFSTMATIRHFETVAGSLFAAGRLPGFIHLSIGQEAVAAGVCGALRPDDQITTTHRGHGHCIAKGGTVDAMMAELFGRAEGYGKGRSGSMHVADTSVGILGANAIVGAGIPIAVGAALSAQVLGEDRIAVCFFGEGAVAQGVFHESLNLAALWKLPIIFVCENNQYAELSHVSLHLSAKHVADFGAPYRIPSSTIDGNDVLTVRAAALEAIERARTGGGPTLLECMTYRWRGHFEGDPQRYREKSELGQWQERDPLQVLRQLMAEGFATGPEELDEIEAAIVAQVGAAADWAEALAPAPAQSLTEDVYRESTTGGVR